MIKIENIETWGMKHAIRGMRNPMNSWDRSDSKYIATGEHFENVDFVIGDNDMTLMRKLYKAGHPHRKFMRQIMVSMDITAPLYWWKEFDTYKVGTTANSCSTMHKIGEKKFELDDFSHEHLSSSGKKCLQYVIAELNSARSMFLPEKTNKNEWWDMIQLLPSSYNQKRTITMNYENVVNILDYRQDHKLDEWRTFCNIMLVKLPYLSDIIRHNERWIFTFSFDSPNRGRYIVFDGNYEEARNKMWKNFGDQWSFQYSMSEWEASKVEFGEDKLEKEISLEEALANVNGR